MREIEREARQLDEKHIAIINLPTSCHPRQIDKIYFGSGMRYLLHWCIYSSLDSPLSIIQ